MAVELFISYHEADEEHLRALEMVLKPVERAGAVAIWHRGRTDVGQDIKAHADRRFETSRVVVLLLSAAYLASDDQYAEAMRALERQRVGAARLVPIVVEPYDQGATELAALQTLPRGAASISGAPNMKQAWADIAVELRALLAQLPQIAAAPAPAAPQPQPPDPRAQFRRRLWEAQAARERLLDLGADDPKLRDEIRDIKQKLRQGGTLRAEDMLGNGRYRLLEQVGKGGFANVWRAAGSAEASEVAVKILHAEHASDTGRLERFFRGARKMARLVHPGVVRVLEPHGEDGDWHYFVMELVRGKNLRDAVLAGEVQKEQAPEIVLAVGEALAEAHRRGMVHRDLKPANILLDEARRPKLTDFDLVTAADSTGGGTRTGGMGTFLYAAPELMHRADDADARADVFGLGMTAVFCWYGRELPIHVLRTPEKVLDALPCENAVRRVLSKAIEWEPEHRYPDAAAFCAALQAATSREARFEELLSWVDIPGGKFLMGSPNEDKEAFNDERPQHYVAVSAFSLSRTPVTVGQYGAVMGKDIGGADPDLPITGMSWRDTLEFCNALSRLAGREPCYVVDKDKVTWSRRANGFRLPTEAEWEYACRAGTTTRYPFGDDPSRLGEYAWFMGNSEDQAQPVGQKRPNPWGLHDMHGNVWEWVWDIYDKYDQGTASDNDEVTVVTSPLDCERVVRGGSFGVVPRWMRSACRVGFRPRFRFWFLGFRCAAPSRKR